MLRSYSAELNGTALVWLDKPPPTLTHARVTVAVEETSELRAPQAPKAQYDFRHLAGRLQWQGDAVAAQRELRDAW